MSEPIPYTDEELTRGVDWGPSQGLLELGRTAARINATINRFRDERDEARRVARLCAELGTRTNCHDDEHYDAAQIALDYPEVKP